MALIALPVILAVYVCTNWLPGNGTITRVRRSAWAGRHPFAHVDAAARLSAGSAALVAAAVVLCLVLPVDRLLAAHVPVFVVLLGIPLGLGVAGVSALACLVAAGVTGMPDATRGGWPRQVRLAAKVLPRPVIVAVVGGFAVAEEILLRGVLITATLPAGPVVALAVAVLVALAVQVFPWTDWESALFPVLGTAVTATVHGLLFLVIADIRPLVVAHLTHLAFSLSATPK